MKKVLGLLLFTLVGISLMGCEVESTQSQDNQAPNVDSYTYEVMATDVISVLFYDESLEVVGYANATFTTSSL